MGAGERRGGKDSCPPADQGTMCAPNLRPSTSFNPSQLPPPGTCSWYMTWFAHDVPSLSQIARLFDLFLSSHPLMPLYVAAVAIKVRGHPKQPGLRNRTASALPRVLTMPPPLTPHSLCRATDNKCWPAAPTGWRHMIR